MKCRDRVGKELLRLYEVEGINLDYYAMVRNKYVMDTVDRMSPDFVVLKERRSDYHMSQFIYDVHEIMIEGEPAPIDVASLLEEINGPPRPRPLFQHECVVLRVNGIKTMLERTYHQMHYWQSRFLL
jgi:hypothetical protein